MDFAIKVPRKDLIDFLSRLKGIDEDTKEKLLKMREGLMEERLQELKEKIAFFINDYNIKEFYVYVDEINSTATEKKVELEIRV